MCDPVTTTSCMPSSPLPAPAVDASADAAGPSAFASGAAGAASLLASRVAFFCDDFAALSATGADCASAGALPSAGPRRSNELVMAADELLRAEARVRP